MSTDPQYDPSADLPSPQFRFEDLKPYDQQFLEQLLIHGHPSKAALAVGRRSNYGAWVLDNRPDVRAVWDQMRLDRSRKLGITADMVLQGLWEQFQRLTAMLDMDIADLYLQDGSMKPVLDWPENWRMGAVEGIETKELFAYSKDGAQAGESKAWDKIGEVNKIKRASRLGIEREIRECLGMIGRHVNVKAFPDNTGKLADSLDNLASVIDQGISEGRKRAAERNRRLPE